MMDVSRTPMSLALWVKAKGIKIKPPAKMTLMALAFHADSHGIATVTQYELADFTCLSRKTIIAAIRQLEEAGYVETETVFGEGGARPTKRYRLTLPGTQLPPSRFRKGKRGSPGYVYYARFDSGIVKIGCSADPVKRLQRLVGQRSHLRHKLVAAFYYPAEDCIAGEREAHELHQEHIIDRFGETFRLPAGEYERRLRAVEGKTINVVDGWPVA